MSSPVKQIIEEVLANIARRLHTRRRGTLPLGAFAQQAYAQLKQNAAILLSLGQPHDIGEEFLGMLKTNVFIEIVPRYRAAQPDCNRWAIHHVVLWRSRQTGNV
jgi:hypothetical protein